jgi:DNA-binding NarL/FixJ family response regulator
LDEARLKVLLVDDHERARRALARRLSHHEQLALAGHTDDPADAHEIVQTHAPHAVLIDPVREDGQGIPLVSSFSALPLSRRPLIVIHLSYYQPEIWSEATRAGAHELALKQTDIDSLAAVLMGGVMRVLVRDRWPSILGA